MHRWPIFLFYPSSVERHCHAAANLAAVTFVTPYFSRDNGPRGKRELNFRYMGWSVRTAVAQIAQDRRLFGIRNDACIYTKPGNEFSSNLGKQSGLERFRLVLSIQLIKIHARDSGSMAWARRSLVRVGLSMFGLGRSFPARDISRIEEREAG